MLEEPLIALAQAGGAAIVQAVATDLWNGIAARFPALFGRGDQSEEAADIEPARLRTTREALTDPDDLVLAQAVQAGVWQGRFLELAEAANETRRALIQQQLQGLIDLVARATNDVVDTTGAARAFDGGHAVSGIEGTADAGSTGSKHAANTGSATAVGPGSKAVSGILRGRADA